ncbi:hypothetical protein MBLNU457_1398t1 [Dothideomycetes sp. NU457]
MASGVLQYVTERKLGRLEKQQHKYEQHKSDLLSAKTSSEDNLEYSRILLEGIKKWGLDKTAGISAHNVDLFLKQKHHDASVPAKSLLQWQQNLEAALDVQSSRYEYASLFGKLVTEWIANPNEANKILNNDQIDDTSMDFEPVGRNEMHQQRAIWEELVFTERQVNQENLLSYLKNLFDDDDSSSKKQRTLKRKFDIDEESSLERLRKGMRTFKITPLETSSLKATITACLASDIFAGKKRAALVDLKDRPAVLDEMVDVLNMDLSALEHWTWEPAPISVTQRRQINGKYRFYMDEEIHQALLLQYVGSCFSIRLKQVFTTFRAKNWSTSKGAMTTDDRKRRTFFLQNEHTRSHSGYAKTELTPMSNEPSVKDIRQAQYDDNFFLLQMQNDLAEGARDYTGENDDEKTKNPMDSKHELLHYLTTDMLYSLAAHKAFTVVQSDFKWFGPGLPHATIIAVLRFFGVKEEMITFIEAFLRTPMVFSQDGPDAVPQVRCRGVPMSHSLSDALGEMVLFTLDYAVNKYTQGDNILRLHDDIWFWGTTESCIDAWTVIQEFSAVTGLELNMEKTGSLQLSHPDAGIVKKSPKLPDGIIKWGFLRLNAEKRGWTIATEDVDAHIKELHLQLSACRSVFAWIQAWNSYVSRFFKNNFGKAANCFGKEHMNSVIATFEHIQASLFPSGSVTAHLKEMISSRFGATDIPDGFLCLPIELGGLDLRNPFIPLISVREGSIDDPLAILRKAFEQEEKAYHQVKTAYEAMDYKWSVEGHYRPHDEMDFFSFEEYTRFRDETSGPMRGAFLELMEEPKEVNVELTRDIIEAHAKVLSLVGGGRNWAKKGYNKWLMMLYGPEVIQRFGGLSIGDKELLPIGLTNLLRSEKFRWQS